MKFKKTKSLLCALVAAFLFAGAVSVPVEAATAFDPYYYFIEYHDVAVAIGKYDAQALFDHYQDFGKAEGRFPNQQAEWRFAAGQVDTPEQRDAFLMTNFPVDPENKNSDLPKFDAIFYYNTYSDVAEVIGNDPYALLQHYFAYGFSEGREPFYGAGPCVEVQTSF